MWADTQEGRDIVAQLSFEVVGDVAPEEQEIFDELLQDFYQHPKTDRPPPESDDPLGFGLDGIVNVATPAVVAMVTTFINFVSTEALKTFQDESAEAIKQKIQDFFAPKKEAPPVDPPPQAEKIVFDRDQLAQIRKASIREARKLGATSEDAERMANALFVRLALT